MKYSEKFGYSVPAVPTDFINLSSDFEYEQTTLSTGKKLLFVKNHSSHFQEAIDTCASHGGLILLPAPEETSELITFMTLMKNSGFFASSPVAWLRVLNVGAPSTQTWVDALDNSPLDFDGPGDGITGYAYNYNTHGHLSKLFLQVAPYLENIFR